MKITALGTGGMYCIENFHTNFVVHNHDSSRLLLVDCGSDIRFSLAALHLPFNAIDAVYVTHMHPDHVGGLPWLAYKSISATRDHRIKLMVHEKLVQPIGQHLEATLQLYDRKRRTLMDYFDIVTVRPTEWVIWCGISLTTHEWIHCWGGNFEPHMLSQGLTLVDNLHNKRIHYPGDINNAEVAMIPAFMDRNKIDLMLQDCYTSLPYAGDQVHPRYSDLLALDPRYRAKLALVHYQDNVLVPAEVTRSGHPEVDTKWQQQAEDDGFYGFLPPHGLVDTETL